MSCHGRECAAHWHKVWQECWRPSCDSMVFLSLVRLAWSLWWARVHQKEMVLNCQKEMVERVMRLIRTFYLANQSVTGVVTTCLLAGRLRANASCFGLGYSIFKTSVQIILEQVLRCKIQVPLNPVELTIAFERMPMPRRHASSPRRVSPFPSQYLPLPWLLTHSHINTKCPSLQWLRCIINAKESTFQCSRALCESCILIWIFFCVCVSGSTRSWSTGDRSTSGTAAVAQNSYFNDLRWPWPCDKINQHACVLTVLCQ